ncbi:MAG: HDOD domain-containing protein [Verrucomicrobiota bacterium]
MNTVTDPSARDETREKARVTLARIHAGLESRVVPMVGQVVRIIRDISGKADRMSVNDLAESINSEPTTMGRIVSMAGSVGFNSHGAEIKSIHHAISLIGFDRVRSLAISILLFEHAQSDHTAAANRELAGAAFVGGLVSSEMARRVMMVDPELAFICGALRGYGRMLAATFLPAEYARSLKSANPENPDASFKAEFGLAPLDLARQLLGGMQMPKAITATFVRLSPPTRRRAAGNATTGLIAAAEMGLRTAELLQTPGLTIDGFEVRMEHLSREYDAPFLLTRTGARELLQLLVNVLECFRFRAGSYVGAVQLFRRIERLMSEHPQPAAAEFRPVVPPAPAPLAPPPPPKPAIGDFDI